MAKGKKATSGMGGILVGVFVIIFIIIVVSLVVLSPQSQTQASKFDDTQSPTRGNLNATVIVHEFSDFGCIHCKNAHPIVLSLVEKYGDRVKFVNKDFPLRSETQAVAEKVRCATKQDKFFELQQLVFEKQEEWGSLTTFAEVTAKLDEYATSLGIDATALNQCVDSGEMTSLVLADKDEGRKNNVNGTPSFFLNGERIPSIAALQQALQERFGE